MMQRVISQLGVVGGAMATEEDMSEYDFSPYRARGKIVQQELILLGRLILIENHDERLSFQQLLRRGGSVHHPTHIDVIFARDVVNLQCLISTTRMLSEEHIRGLNFRRQLSWVCYGGWYCL